MNGDFYFLNSKGKDMKFKKISNIILLTVIFFVLATQLFSIIVFANYTYDFENMTEQESISWFRMCRL